jgi:hypothetical protein|tara:strand:+ start:1414 stop:1653 length:240 start_codon:yes stop_codon:yes gene_type:complete
MSLTKTVTVDNITVQERGTIQVRTATAILEDGVELSRTFHRHVLHPGDDLSGQDPRTTAIAQATWTDTVLADWQTFLEA